MTDLTKYPRTSQFYIKDTIPLPHPYMITPRHVAIAADRHGGMLGKEAIEDAERRGIHCGQRGCTLSLAEHEQALLVAVRDNRALKDIPELKDYLLSIKDMATQDGFAGFAFIQEEPYERETTEEDS